MKPGVVLAGQESCCPGWLASPGSFLGMQSVRPTPGLLYQNLHPNEILGQCACTPQAEKNWARTLPDPSEESSKYLDVE